jgi:large subunit ribosomal protein L24
MPMPASNVAIICSACGPTRIGYRFDGDNKIRICKKCKSDL